MRKNLYKILFYSALIFGLVGIAKAATLGNTVTALPITPFIYTNPIPTITPSITSSSVKIPSLATSTTNFLSVDSNGKLLVRGVTSSLSGDFLYKPGIAGGQTAFGGTGAAQTLQLWGSTDQDGHVKVGDLFDFDEENDILVLNDQGEATSLTPEQSSAALVFKSSAWDQTSSTAVNEQWNVYSQAKSSAAGAFNDLLFSSNSGGDYFRFRGGDYKQMVVGVLPEDYGEEDPNVSIFAMRDVNDYSAINSANKSSGDRASADFVAFNDSPTAYVTMGIQSTNNTNPDYALIGKNGAYVYSNDANLNLGSAGMTSSTGNTYIFAGGTDDPANIKAAFTYDGKLGIGTTTPNWPLDVKGEAHFLNAVGINCDPDSINYNFSVCSPISVGIDMEAGTGYNLLFLKRKLGFATTTALGYYGLGSLFNNDIGFGAYDVGAQSGGFSWATKNLERMYVSSTGNEYYGFNQSDDLFSIGEAKDSSLTARLQVKDGRDASTDRTAVKIDTNAAAWSAKSRLISANVGGTEKWYVDSNGISSQLTTSSVQSVANAPVLLFSKTLAAFRTYSFKVRLQGLQSGGTSQNVNIVLDAYFSKRTTGAPIQEGNTHYDCKSNLDCTSFSLPYFVINGDAVEVWARGRAAENWIWTGWLNFEVQA